MKRDWEQLRKQLTDIEEDRDVFAEVPPEPQWGQGQTEAEYKAALEAYQVIEDRVCGHLELLIQAGFVEGITLRRGMSGNWAYAKLAPRLTMAGHDFLDTMRSKTMWESIKSTAKTKGLELTIEAIKQIGAYCLKQVIGG